LSRYLYGNPIIRESFDLDFLVDPNDIAGMTELFAREKITPVLAPPLSPRQTAILFRFNKHDQFLQVGRGLMVECHYGLDHNRWRLATDFESLWRHRQTVALAGETIAFPATATWFNTYSFMRRAMLGSMEVVGGHHDAVQALS